jgi:phosphoglycerate dehydrogenase-like enzyme
LVIAFPVTEDTRGMFGMNEFRKMRRDAYLVNIARGSIVKESELVAALKEGVFAGAVLDVFEKEPLPESSPLWEMDNVIISPHDSGPSLVSDNADFFLANLKRYRAGEPLAAVVDMGKKY